MLRKKSFYKNVENNVAILIMRRINYILIILIGVIWYDSTLIPNSYISFLILFQHRNDLVKVTDDS